jgi:glycosyltransferase involved in cell wall biosynthesis
MTHAPQTKPSVLMIAFTYYRSDPRVIREAEAAVGAGFDVDFMALRRRGEPAEEKIQGVRVIHLKQDRYQGSGMLGYVLTYLTFFLRSFFKTSRLQLKRNYRVVHVNNMPDFYVFCALLPKLMGARVFLDIHDPMPNTFVSKFKNRKSGLFYLLLLWQERISAAFADHVLTVSDPVKDFVLVRQHGLRADAVEVIANFADDALFSLREPRRFEAGLKLVFHGTILERYGLPSVMRALAGIRHRDRITVKIIGDGDYSAQLKELIAALRLGDIVDFENRLHPVHTLPGILRDYNVGLVPLEISSITNYALPLKLLEYLSLGMPAITVRNEAIAYYFGGDDLIYYQPDSPDSLRLLLDRLVENPAILYHYQERAAILRERFLWSRERQKYAALLRESARAD